MEPKELRSKMEITLKKIVVPFLRENGFKGSFPHFRRSDSDRVNLLTFQFSMYESKFTVNISNCSLLGIYPGWGNVIPVAKCTAYDMDRRHRIGRDSYNRDYWFDLSSAANDDNVFDICAGNLLQLWDEAEHWWKADIYEQRFEKLPLQ